MDRVKRAVCLLLCFVMVAGLLPMSAIAATDDQVNAVVDFNEYEPATEYPEYPNDGAVRIDKTATHSAAEFNRTGVTRVELDVAGVSVQQSIDVILIMDISNSMSWNDETYNYNDTDIVEGSAQRLNIARTSAKEFVSELMSENSADGTATSDNSVTVLAFAGIDAEYNTHQDAKGNDDVYQLGSLAMTTVNDANSALDQLVKAHQGGTNYDYAFQQAYALAEQLHRERGKDVYVVFMTDGAPTHYNGVYYKNRSGNGYDLHNSYLYTDPVTGASRYYVFDGTDGNGHDIDYTATQNITVYYNDGSTRTKNVTYNEGWSDYLKSNKNAWAEKVKELDYVKHVYAIGFGMKNGSVLQGAITSMPTLNYYGGTYYIPRDVTHATLQNIASDSASHFEADNEAELSKLYAELATKIKYAGTNAVVTDVVGEDFTVQMYPYVLNASGNQIALTTPPSISITTYSLYPRGTVIGEEDVTGKRTGESTDIETVTFALVDGVLEAYSNVIGEGVNILSTDADGNITIQARYFTYTKNASTGEEVFVWNIGNITDKEIALSYDVYLKGSMEGECPPQEVYFTNEEAKLEYLDINGDYAQKLFPVPGVAWGGATTTIRFYLVNEKGEPVNRDGEVIPWENRIYVGDPVLVALNLNADLTVEAQTIQASAYVPSQYFLYDYNAYYTVQTTSSADAIVGGITVSEPSDDAFKTTGTAPNQVTQTGAQTTRVISHEETYYTWSYVGFGVRWDLTAEQTEYVLKEDQVVIDYGKSILIDVLDNDPDREGYSRELTGFIKYDANADLTYVQNNPGASTFTADFGEFSISGDKVQFTPSRMIDDVQQVFYAVRYTADDNSENSYIVWGKLTVIPATIMYYETNFADGVFTIANFGDAKTDGTAADGPQDDGSVGGNTYGYDSSYEDDAMLSNGSSLFAEGQGVTTTTASFSFTGTGFDLISRTGAEQGIIKVQVAKDAAMTEIVKTVSVLNKSESNLELYQIPVVSINGLDYGTYYVTVGVGTAYTNESFPALNRGNEFCFDALRVYDPAKGNTVAEAAYSSDGEYNNDIAEVRALLLDAETYATVDGSTTGMLFIDRDQDDVNVATYATIGPNNEAYLSKNQAVAFKVSAVNPASFDIGAKSITGAAANLSVTIIGGDTWTVEKEIASSTVQYINLLTGTKTINGEATVVITNTGDGVLSITDLKTAFTNAASTTEQLKGTLEMISTVSTQSVKPEVVENPYAVSYTVDAATFEAAKAVLTDSDVTEPDVDTSIYNILNASVKVNGSVKNRKVTITAVTSQEVADIQVSSNGIEIEPARITFKDNKKSGTREWTIVLSLRNASNLGNFTLVGLSADGVTGAPYTVSNKR